MSSYLDSAIAEYETRNGRRPRAIRMTKLERQALAAELSAGTNFSIRAWGEALDRISRDTTALPDAMPGTADRRAMPAAYAGVPIVEVDAVGRARLE
jgi:hypothetical protein